MHELSISENILNIVENEAHKHNLKRIKEIIIKTGEISDIIPENLEYCFEIISKGTVAEGAKIIVEKLPIKILCLDCGKEFTIKKSNLQCPECNSKNLKLTGGNEFFIESMEAE
jgi:hydrogenase nickel incorporation protein HypA/HybF